MDVKEAGQEDGLVHGLFKRGLRAIQGVGEEGDLDDEDEVCIDPL